MKHINLKESKKWKVLILMIVLSFVFLSLYAVAQCSGTRHSIDY